MILKMMKGENERVSETLPVKCPCCEGRKSSFPKSIFIPVSSQVEGKWKGQKKFFCRVSIFIHLFT